MHNPCAMWLQQPPTRTRRKVPTPSIFITEKTRNLSHGADADIATSRAKQTELPKPNSQGRPFPENNPQKPTGATSQPSTEKQPQNGPEQRLHRKLTAHPATESNDIPHHASQNTQLTENELVSLKKTLAEHHQAGENRRGYPDLSQNGYGGWRWWCWWWWCVCVVWCGVVWCGVVV